MRRDKAVIRILLILSVVHVAASAPAIIRQRSLEVSKDVTPASEKRGNSDDESSQEDPLPASRTPHLHNGEPPTPGAPPLQDDMSSASEDPQVHDDPSPWRQHTKWRPPKEMLQAESSLQSDDDPWRDVHHTYWRPPRDIQRVDVPGAPSFPDDQWQHANWAPPVEVLPELRNGPPPPPSPAGSEVHDEGASWSSDFDSVVPMRFDSEAPSWHLEMPQPLESEALPSAPETHTFFNDALKQKLKVSAGVGAVAGVFVGLALGVNKLIKDHSHKSQPAGRDLASGGVVSRGESILPPKRPVSRAYANLRTEDLRLLSILTRRALERLD